MGGLYMNKVLVAYFSASGVTKGVAEKLAKVSDGDLFEIVPQNIYTDVDLNWMDRNSRSSVEMRDRSSRPEIASRVENMAGYDYVFIGFPIWWYREPSIIDTFMEQYDFSGKIIIPFATSGSSDIGEAPESMQNIVKNAEVREGKRFAANVSENELKIWFDNIINK